MSVFDIAAVLTGNSTSMVGAFRSAEGAALQFGGTFKKVAAEHETASGVMMATMGKVAMAGGALVVAGAAMSVDLAAKFQKSTELLKTAGGMTEANLAKARDGILEISQSTGIAAEDLSKGMYIVTKVTKDAGQGLQILKAAAQGAVAEGVDMGVMTTALTSVMTTYNLTADKAVSTENALIVAAGEAKSTMQDFAGSLSTVLPIAQSAGLSFAQVAGAIATMTQHGTSAQEATQELHNGIQNLLAPSTVAVKEMGQLGLSSLDISQNLGKRGLTGTVQMLSDAIMSHTKGTEVLLGTYKQSEMAAQALNTMFGGLPPTVQKLASEFLNGSISSKAYMKDINGLDAHSANLGRQFATLYRASNGFSDALRTGSPAAQTYVGAMSKMMGGTTGLQVAMMLGESNMAGFKRRVDDIGAAMNKSGKDISTNADTQATLAAQAARVKATFEALAIKIGGDLIPVVSKLLDGTMQVVQWMEKNRDVVEAVAKGVVIGAAAFMALSTALFFVANPLMLIPVAIGAVIAGFVAMYAKVGWFKDGIDKLVKTYWDIDKVFNTWVKNQIDGFSKWYRDTSKNFTDFQDRNKQTYDAAFGGFDKTVNKWFDDQAKGFGKWYTDTSKQFDKWAGDNLKSFGKWDTDTNAALSKAFGEFGKKFAQWDKDSNDNLSKWVPKSVQNFKDWDKQSNDEITKAFKDMGTSFTNWQKSNNDSMMTFEKQWGDNWTGFWKDPIGEEQNFEDTINPKIDNWFKTTIEGFKGWDADWSKTLEKWNVDSNAQFVGFFDDSHKNLTKWGAESDKQFVGFFDDSHKNLSKWGADFLQGFKSWDQQWSDTLDKWFAKTVTDFFNWGQGTKKTTSDTMKANSQTITDGTKHQTSTFEDWHNSIQGWMNQFHDNTTGKTRQTLDTVIKNFNDFNRTTNKTFSDWVGYIGVGFAQFGYQLGHMWDGIMSAASVPVAFVVNTVYNDGIRKAFNGVSDFLHLGVDLPPAHFAQFGTTNSTTASGGMRNGVQHFAAGGVMPGYSPGVDNHIIAVGGGEAIMRPEWTQAIGAQNVHAMNAAARQGGAGAVRSLLGFANGGIIGDIGSFLANPLGGITQVLAPFSSMLGATGGYGFGMIANSFPKTVMSGIQSHIAGWIGGMMASAGGGGTGPGTPVSAAGAGVQQWASVALQALSMTGQSPALLGTLLRRMNQESGGNPNAINNWDSNAAMGDPSRGLMQVIGSTFAANAMPGYNANIYDPLSNILASIRYAVGRYGSLAAAYNQPGGYATGGVVPVFDNGGVIAPGLNTIYNATGRPERLSNTTDQLHAGQTLVLDIPELGGRLKAYVRSEIAGNNTDINRALRNSAGVPGGGF